MKKSFKRIIATALATTLCAGVSSISASAYANSASWNLYYNPYQVRDFQTLQLVTYGNGYLACMTGKTGGSANYVVISSSNIQNPPEPITELNEKVPLKYSYSAYDYVLIDVDFEWSGGTYLSNQGYIKINA